VGDRDRRPAGQAPTSGSARRATTPSAPSSGPFGSLYQSSPALTFQPLFGQM